MLLPLTLLQGCLGGGGGNSSTATTQSAVRMVNGSYNYPSLDLLIAGTATSTGVATASASSYATITAGTYTTALQTAGSSVYSSTFGFAAGVNYTLVAYNLGQQLQMFQISDNAAAPAAGYGGIQFANLSGVGSVDVYMTPVGTDPTTAQPQIVGLAGTTGSPSTNQQAKGNYHIWITGTGNPADLRLDIPTFTLSDQQLVTLVLSDTTGGTLLNGLFITQGGAVSAAKNTMSRIRLAGSLTTNGTISATVNGVSLGTTLSSPVLSNYFAIPSGALTTSITVNGTAVASGSLTAPAGADLTLLMLGNPAAPTFTLLNDDNTRPTPSTSTKLRLVNGVNGLGGTISLYANFTPVVPAVPASSSLMSPPLNSSNILPLRVNFDAGGIGQIDPLQGQILTGLSPGVYSVFVLGNSTAPTAFMSHDH